MKNETLRLKGVFRGVITVLLVIVATFIAQACGKDRVAANDPPAAAEQGTGEVSADAPGAVISDLLKQLKGRWVRENNDPNTPNPQMMRLAAVADNTLGGRFLVGGGFADTGVAATLVEDPPATFTFTLREGER